MKLLLFSLMLFLPLLSIGQMRMESYDLLNDTIKREVKSFHLLAAQKGDTFDKLALAAIPLVRCADSFAYFTNGNFFSSKIMIAINSVRNGTSYKINRIRYMHVKYTTAVPDSAFSDIEDPVFCGQFTKKPGRAINNVRAFCSSDGNRIYLDLLTTKNNRRYEICWIFQDSKYLQRTIDAL